MATLRPNVFPAKSEAGRAAEVVAMAAPAVAPKARVVRLEQPGTQEQDVAEASIIVSGVPPPSSEGSSSM